MDQMDWELLNLVVSEKSAARISQKLFISQPAVIYRLNRMEAEHGCSLFHRSNRGITLTEAGETLLTFADKVLDQYRQISLSISSRSSYVNTITVGAPYSLTTYVISLMDSFRKEHKDVQFHLYTASSYNLLKRVQEGQLHTAFVRGILGEHPNMRTLFTDPLRLISKEPITLKTIADMPFIDYDMTTVQRHWLQIWADRHLQGGLHRAFYADNLRCCFQMVEAGFGWSIATSLLLLQKDHSSIYTYLPTDQAGEPLQVENQFLFSDEAEKLQMASQFIDHVLNSEWIGNIQKSLESLSYKYIAPQN